MAPGLIAHLSQSTLLVVAAWLAAWMLRANRAQVRYWVWFAASAKFLVPFSLLVRLGTLLPHRAVAPLTQTGWAAALQELSQPLALSTEAVNFHGVASATNYSYLRAVVLALWAI